MRLFEMHRMDKQELFEVLNCGNNTGFLTEDLVSITNQYYFGNWTTLTEKEVFAEMGLPPTGIVPVNGTLFRRCDDYRRTKANQLQSHPNIREKIHKFFHEKRNDPNARINEKPFILLGAKMTAADHMWQVNLNIGGLRLVYRRDGNTFCIFGIYTHDELGTGAPNNYGRQKNMANKFRNTVFDPPIIPTPPKPKPTQPVVAREKYK